MLHSCAFPPAANLSQRSPTAEDVKLPVPWCEAEAAPRSPVRSLEDLAASNHAGPVTVFPSLLVPCCAHSGTTFLWRCMLYAFHPQRVCGTLSRSAHNPRYAQRHDEWSTRQCGARRYLLPGLAGNIEGHFDYRKEWFFYGGGGGSWAKGWAEYAGVDLPLCYWEPEFQRLLRNRPLDDTLQHSRALCLGADAAEGGRAGGSCTHRACIPLDLDRVRLNPSYADQYDRRVKPRWQFQPTKALPRVAPRRHTGAVVSDMTPNYLCSPKALKNLAGTLGAPRHFKMLLLTRSPIGMINASYKMFIQWNWVRTSDLASDVRAQLKALRECNETLYARPQLLSSLPAPEVLTYFGRCWRGTWRDFVANAMPYVCLRAWMAAGFGPEQFMLVRQARLRKAKADALLAQLSNFTGLHYAKGVLQDKAEELNVHCEAPPNPKPPPDYGVSGRRRTASLSDATVAAGEEAGAAARGGGRWRRAHERAQAKAAFQDAVNSRPLVNTHADYTGNDAVRRTQLTGETLAELTRLASAHTSLLDGLGLRELDV